MLGVGCRSDPYAGWVEVRSSDWKFKIKFPRRPEEKGLMTPDGRRGRDFFALVEDSKGAGFGRFDVNVSEALIPDEVIDKAGLDRAEEALLARFDGRLVKSAEFKLNEKFLGRDVELKFPKADAKARTKFFNANGLSYQISLIADTSSKEWRRAELFFDTFELLP
jgi:hypothetical protein